MSRIKILLLTMTQLRNEKLNHKIDIYSFFNPDDLPSFIRKIIEQVNDGKHQKQVIDASSY